MTRLDRAVEAPERMDAPDVDPDALRAALDHIVAVNRWLGARRALLRHLPWALPDVPVPGRGGPVRVLDVGTGAADLAAAIARWAVRRGRPARVTGLDLHAETLAAARERTAVELVRGDGLQLPFRAGAFDLVHLGMTLHHMDGPALITLLREAARVGRGGRLLVSELERALPNYIGARLLAASLWRGNPVTRHDGPLSVLRSFTPAELLELAREAGLQATVHRHPFYRLVLRAEA
jgi:SAM-dependent methyltransferase